MFRYGFELETFYYVRSRISSVYIGIPPKEWPCDGMPGLIELRSSSHRKLDNAYYDMLHQMRKHKIPFHMLALVSTHTFTPDEKRELRKRDWGKQGAEIKNIYGKKPRALGNRTIASLQLNISNLAAKAYTNDKGAYTPDRFELLDIAGIVQRLDKEFDHEIKLANRQPGEYAIKNGVRLEYRSLPNTVAKFEVDCINKFLDRIEKAVEG